MADTITHEAALEAITAGASKARALGEPSSLAIVDADIEIAQAMVDVLEQG